MKLHSEIANEYLDLLALSSGNQLIAYRAMREMAQAESNALLKSIRVDSHAELRAEFDRLCALCHKLLNAEDRLLKAKRPSLRKINEKEVELLRARSQLKSVGAALGL